MKLASWLRAPFRPIGTAVLAGLSALAFLLPLPLAAQGTWSASVNFASTQGTNNWNYLQRPASGGALTNLSFSTGAWRTTDPSVTGWMQGAQGHPGQTTDVIKQWVAPSAGVVSVSGRVFKLDRNGPAGSGNLLVSVEKVSSGTTAVIWPTSGTPQLVAYNDGIGYTTDADLGAVTVAAGDKLNFVVDNDGHFGNDWYGWDPTITYLASHNALAEYGSTQGLNNWFYQQEPQGGGAITNLTFATGAWRTTDAGVTGWMQGDQGHPGQTLDVVKQWKAAANGTIAVTGRVFKLDVSGPPSTNLLATVTKTSGGTTTTLWGPRLIAYNDSTGYLTDGALGSVAVLANDVISFVVDDDGTYGNDHYGWNPTIAVRDSNVPGWVLNSADTLMTVTVMGNKPVITRLEDSATATGWNWTPWPVTVPLLDKVWVGGTPCYPNWIYNAAATTYTSSGGTTTLTLAFTSSNAANAGISGLTLTQVWTAHSGAGGPVEMTAKIQNSSGSNLTYYSQDMVAIDLPVQADAATNLWQFYRVNVGASTGLSTTGMTSGTSVTSTISNDDTTDSDGNGRFRLPFIMLDVPGATRPHGLYLGYESDFGVMQETAATSASNRIRNLFFVATAGALTDGSASSVNTTLTLPGMFFGAYTGDTDTGSNTMKRWFWANKMTPTIKSTSNEPLVSLSLAGGGYDANSHADAVSLFAAYPASSLGYEMGKEDAGWGDDQSGGNAFGWDWNPSTTGWTSGMDLGTLTHGQGVKLSLYMANRYNHADLSTAAGVSSEQAALSGRFAGTTAGWSGPGFDYWRSDIDYEGVYDYAGHLGFMQVVDYMIAHNAGFRWENCSSGGAKKSFDLLQRQSFLNTVDDPFPTTSFRQAYYGNSYMINPVQMQFTSYENSSATGVDAYTQRNGFLGAWLAGLPTPYLPGIVSLYQTKQRPILRGADVYHILPVADGTHWDGFEFINPTLATNPKGSVVLFKPDSSTTTSGTFYLKGLNPATTYTLTFQDRTGMNTTKTGAQLMAGGTGLSLSGASGAFDSEIIWLSW